MKVPSQVRTPHDKQRQAARAWRSWARLSGPPLEWPVRFSERHEILRELRGAHEDHPRNAGVMLRAALRRRSIPVGVLAGVVVGCASNAPGGNGSVENGGSPVQAGSAGITGTGGAGASGAAASGGATSIPAGSGGSVNLAG